jgi:methylmalonyl-CoA epimerase
MILKIDHVGIVVENDKQTVEGLSRLFGFEEKKAFEEPNQGFVSHLINKNAAGIEILSPTNPESGIARFLRRKGGGIHHISFEVDNIENETARLMREGVKFVTAKPQIVDGLKVIFAHPESTFGLLIELVEKGLPITENKE